MPDRIHDIVLIGAGRLATHLGMALLKHGFTIVQVINRTPSRGKRLARKLGASYCGNLTGIDPGADLYLIAVSDSYLPEIASSLRLRGKLAVHTSGSMAMDVIAPVSDNIGVLYPVQTFTGHRRIDFSKVPVCIEGNSENAAAALRALAEKLTGTVHSLTSEQRGWLHLGAVFASNFTNHLYGVAEDLLLEHDIPPRLLEPIIRQTAGNISRGNMFSLQTGPAVRNDAGVMALHQAMLAGKPEFLMMYRLITDSIIKQHSLDDEL